MRFFSKRPEIDHDEQDRRFEQAKRESGRRLNEIRDRIGNGTATREDKRIFNATQKRGHRIK
ncbi:hypothetical protein [Streptomyces xanthophaeus]|uniref:Uncharacterized protein n=1 Tax=Streptomyces xanthophaeus TaxID=67385 RepID=A0A919H1S7_9ACTN|nr:hypothetical protein [Streptomyces xanthophaeus]GHI88771.1 hypothetical protein Sxan_61350 [Streptomyces xanthophaeus]